jgi:hypothetical protein
MKQTKLKNWSQDTKVIQIVIGILRILSKPQDKPKSLLEYEPHNENRAMNDMYNGDTLTYIQVAQTSMLNHAKAFGSDANSEQID